MATNLYNPMKDHVIIVAPSCELDKVLASFRRVLVVHFDDYCSAGCLDLDVGVFGSHSLRMPQDWAATLAKLFFQKIKNRFFAFASLATRSSILLRTLHNTPWI